MLMGSTTLNIQQATNENIQKMAAEGAKVIHELLWFSRHPEGIKDA